MPPLPQYWDFCEYLGDNNPHVCHTFALLGTIAHMYARPLHSRLYASP